MHAPVIYCQILQIPYFATTMSKHSQTPSRKILIVDNDQAWRDQLHQYLTEQGLDVYAAKNSEHMRQMWQGESFDLLILDLALPDEDGLSICRRLRNEHNNVFIIMTSVRTEPIDRILGLEMGADDYLSKPIDLRELLARIHAIFRRRTLNEHPGAPSQGSEPICFGPYVLNLATRTLTRHGEPVSMTTGEFSMLKAFARHAKIPLSRNRLMELARGRAYADFDRSLDVQISRLRKLIEPNPAKPTYIQTVWGVGYVFVPGDDVLPGKSKN